jgi:hypothetical protein
MPNEKAIRIFERPLIPMDLVDSATSMDSYLTQLREDSKNHEKYRLRSAKAVRTRKFNLEAAARQIKVEPAGPTQQQQKTWKCKKETDKPVEEEPREGSLVVETIKGIIVVCDFCGHRWTHHSKNLGRQYYTQCGICRRNVRLKHYQ